MTRDTSSTVRTAVGQDGGTVNAFFLSKHNDRWSFGRYPSDSTSGVVRAESGASTVQTDTWVHLVGVYDAGAGEIRLYVNDVLADTESCSCGWIATGAFTIGRGKDNGGPVGWWLGSVDDVRVWQGVLSDAQVSSLHSQ